MVRVELKGIAKVKAKGQFYYYAWRGGPRLLGKPGSPEFMASYNAAIEDRRAPDTSRFRSLVTLYKASADYKKLANSTKRNWASWLTASRQATAGLLLSTSGFTRPVYSGITEFTIPVLLGGHEKIVSLCRTYYRLSSALWLEDTSLHETLLSGTLGRRS